jgi:Na+-translocating ferredoxin:NAD+ oxidoreductase subunit B
MIMATVVIALLGTGLGLLLGIAARFLAVEDENPLVKQVEALLPGSQCGQCGFPGCSPAAQAVAEGKVGLHFCGPGGRTLVESLAKLLNVDPNTLGEVPKPLIARIDANLCTGCTRCFRACPTDAVVGANGQIHVVLENACTGCKRCSEACPEDCISLQSIPENLDSWHWPKPQLA